MVLRALVSIPIFAAAILIGVWAVAVILGTAGESYHTSDSVFFMIGGLALAVAAGLALVGGLLVKPRAVGELTTLGTLTIGAGTLFVLVLLARLVIGG